MASKLNRTILETALLALKLKENADVKEHVDNFFDLVGKLEELTIEIGDKLQSLMLLQSLPDSFDNFRCAIEARDALPSPEALKTKICDEARSRRDGKGNANAMMVNGSDKKPRNAKRKKQSTGKFQPIKNVSNDKVICFGCNKPGHFISKCPERVNKNEANVTKSHISMHVCNTVESLFNVTELKQWCIDSGCTTHLCKERHMFDELVAMEDEVNLANNASAKVKGKGTVTVRSSTGKSIRFCKTLHVPELRNNLLSVSKMTDAGNTVKFYSTHAIIKNEKSGEVLFTADRIGDLYYLNTDTLHQVRAASNKEYSKLRD